MAKMKKGAKKTKEKKTLSLKLKKQIRLTLGSVFLITAIVIAAIPPGDIEASIFAAADSDDNRGNVDYKMQEVGESERDFLKRPINFDPDNNPNHFISYSIYPLAGTADSDSWIYVPQFECSNQVVDPSLSGVIVNRYIQGLPPEYLEIKNNMIMDYFTVSAQKFENFFSEEQGSNPKCVESSGTWAYPYCDLSADKHGSGDYCNKWDETDVGYPSKGPGAVAYEYDFKDWYATLGPGGAPISTIPDMPFIEKTWPDAYEAYNRACQIFYEYLEKYKQYELDLVSDPALSPPLRVNQPGGDNPFFDPAVAAAGDFTDVGFPRSLSPAKNLNEEQQYKFYCDYAARISFVTTEPNNRHRIPVNPDSGFTLKDVQDSTNQSAKLANIYIPRGPKTEARVDDNGFLTKDVSALVIGIGDGAFKGYDAEYDLTIPKGVLYIGNQAFANSLITYIDLTDVQEIGDQAFYGCKPLKEITFGIRTSKIGIEAFNGSGLLEATFTRTINEIGYGAFASCDNLTKIDMKAFTLEKRVINDYAFYDCINLKEVLFEDNTNSVFIIGEGAFAMPPGTSGGAMASIILPNNINGLDDDDGKIANNGYLGNYLFANRPGLRSVTMPRNYGNIRPGLNETIQIPSGMFVMCTDLEEVIFPNSRNGTNGGFASFQTTYGDDSPIAKEPNENYRDTVNAGLVDEDGKLIDPDDTRNKHYMGKYLFRDVMTSNFKVIGPEFFSGTSNNRDAFPRISTWYASTAVREHITYQFIRGSSGNDIYEISNGEYILQFDEKEGGLTGIRLLADNDLSLKEFEDEFGKDHPRRFIHLEIPSHVGCSHAGPVHEAGCIAIKNIDGSLLSDPSQRNLRERLRTVDIGGQIETIGDRAFAECVNLVEVTFRKPSDYGKHQIIGDAFKTGSQRLVFNGDINTDYAPYQYAMGLAPYNRDNGLTGNSNGVRILYKSLSPDLLTVILDNNSGEIVLMNYPKYDTLDDNNQSHLRFMERYYTRMYADAGYNDARVRFVEEYIEYDKKNPSSGTFEKFVEGNADLYGPWINEAYLDGLMKATDTKGSFYEDKTRIENIKPFYDFMVGGEKINQYSIISNYENGNPRNDRPFEQPFVDLLLGINEREMVIKTQEIEIPKGVTSIDAHTYLSNNEGSGRNSADISAYFIPPGREITPSEAPAIVIEEYNMIMGISPYLDNIEEGPHGNYEIIGGLFSGYYVDYKDGTEEREDFEAYLRGNDQIRKITMHSIKELPQYAFDSCERLEYVYLGEGLSDIGLAPFRGCIRLETVEIPDENMKYFVYNKIIYSHSDDHAGKFQIEQVLPTRGKLVQSEGIFPDRNNPQEGDEYFKGVISIAESAFADNQNLLEVDLSMAMGLKAIPIRCFENTSLQAIYLPESVEDIKELAFSRISKPLQVNVPTSRKWVNIHREAFFATDSVSITGSEDSNLPGFADDNANVSFIPRTGFTVNFWDLDEDGELILSKIDRIAIRTDADRRPAIAPEPKGRSGHRFNKWQNPDNFEISDIITMDTFFIADYVSNLDTGLLNVIFYDTRANSGEGEIMNPDNQWFEAGAVFYPPPTKTYSGWTFQGWLPDGNANGWRVEGHRVYNTDYRPSGSGSDSGSGTGTDSSDSSTKYTVSVSGGSGSGQYTPGELVMISAYAADGRAFDRWTTASTGVSLLSANSAVTVFRMPGNNVSVTATYKSNLETSSGGGSAANNASGGSGIGTSGSGSNLNGGTTSGRTNASIQIVKPGIPNHELASATVSGSLDDFVIRITDNPAATALIIEALQKKYGSLYNIRYFPMDITLYDASGIHQITDTAGLSISITLPLPADQILYGGSNQVASAQGGTLEHLSPRFSTVDGVPCITFTATHFSPYVIYADLDSLSVSVRDDTPKTGDGIHPKWFLVIGLTCLALIMFLKKEKVPELKTT